MGVMGGGKGGVETLYPFLPRKIIPVPKLKHRTASHCLLASHCLSKYDILNSSAPVTDESLLSSLTDVFTM